VQRLVSFSGISDPLVLVMNADFCFKSAKRPEIMYCIMQLFETLTGTLRLPDQSLAALTRCCRVITMLSCLWYMFVVLRSAGKPMPYKYGER
jgi:hypothetical protein